VTTGTVLPLRRAAVIPAGIGRHGVWSTLLASNARKLVTTPLPGTVIAAAVDHWGNMATLAGPKKVVAGEAS
jgi:hypothetical protein